MTGIRQEVYEKLAGDVSTWTALGVFDDEPWNRYGEVEGGPSDEELEAALEAYAATAPLEAHVDRCGLTYVAADVLLELFERQGAVVHHDPLWKDAERAADQIAAWDEFDDEASLQLVDMADDSRRAAPTSYDALIEEYVALAGGGLDGVNWTLEGDRRTDNAVTVRCERAGRQFEATLDAGDEVDVAGLIELLNEVLIETALEGAEWRFTEPESWPGRVYVFFLHRNDVDVPENYLSRAVGAFQSHVGES